MSRNKRRILIAALAASIMISSSYASSLEFSLSPAVPAGSYITDGGDVTYVDISKHVSPGFIVSVGGFADMFGEDIDLSLRIRDAGFTTALFRDAYVYHKRRVSFRSFYRQVYVFGMARVDLYRLHPESLKVVHLLPACFVLGTAALIVGAFFWPWTLLPLAFYYGLLFLESLAKNRSLPIALLSLLTCTIQLGGYGLGFLKAFITKVVLKKKVDREAELAKHYKKK